MPNVTSFYFWFFLRNRSRLKKGEAAKKKSNLGSSPMRLKIRRDNEECPLKKNPYQSTFLDMGKSLTVKGKKSFDSVSDIQISKFRSIFLSLSMIAARCPKIKALLSFLVFFFKLQFFLYFRHKFDLKDVIFSLHPLNAKLSGRLKPDKRPPPSSYPRIPLFTRLKGREGCRGPEAISRRPRSEECRRCNIIDR